jgi:uncharacterized NAD-dependent epimerase/dehydratase family protein
VLEFWFINPNFDSETLGMKKENAVLLTGGFLATNSAKTAHGLIRGSERFTIVGVIDHNNANKDAGEILDGKHRNIPVFSSFEDFSKANISTTFCIVGVATKGGVIPEALRTLLMHALHHGLDLVSGLHEYLQDIPALATLAKEKGLTLTDVRKPKPFKDLHFWSGKIQRVACPKIAVLGTDCSLGKRTTTRYLVAAMRQAGFQAEWIYTGQTGWMQGAKYGFIFDSTLNDFVSGELEHAVVSCYDALKPDIIFIEGQSSLRNPSGPAGAEWLLSANVDGVVLQHDPTRKHYKDMEFYPALVAQPEEEIALIKAYGKNTVAITLNTAHLNVDEAQRWKLHYEQHVNIPVALPHIDGVESLVPLFKAMIESNNKK